MNIRPAQARPRAVLLTEWAVAMGVLTVACLPLAFEFMHEVRFCRALYQRAVAMELVDGEIEVLAAGEWRAFAPGRHRYPVRAAAATNLPPGEFILTLEADRVRLEWTPQSRGQAGAVAREVRVK